MSTGRTGAEGQNDAGEDLKAYKTMLAMGGAHILYRAEIHAIASWGEAIYAWGDTLPDRRAAKILRALIEGQVIEFVEVSQPAQNSNGIEAYGNRRTGAEGERR